MKIFQKIILSYKILKIRKIWCKFLNISKSLRSAEKKKESFIKIFIQDEEDKELNKNVLDKYDEKVNKLKSKRNKLRIKLDKILFNFGFFEENVYETLIVECADLGIKPIKIEFLKDILKYYIKNDKASKRKNKF